MAKLLDNPVQIGVVGLRDPDDPKKIIKNVPLYVEGTPATDNQEEKNCEDIAKFLAAMYKQYEKGIKKLK